MVQMRSLVFEYAERNNLQHPFNKETKQAGLDWTTGFRERHGLALRTPQKTSIARIAGFNKEQVRWKMILYVGIPNTKIDVY